MDAYPRLSALYVVAVIIRSGLLESELASLLVDLETGGPEGTVLFPSVQVLIHLQPQSFPSLAWREDHGVEGAGGVEMGLVERLP